MDPLFLSLLPRDVIDKQLTHMLPAEINKLSTTDPKVESAWKDERFWKAKLAHDGFPTMIGFEEWTNAVRPLDVTCVEFLRGMYNYHFNSPVEVGTMELKEKLVNLTLSNIQIIPELQTASNLLLQANIEITSILPRLKQWAIIRKQIGCWQKTYSDRLKHKSVTHQLPGYLSENVVPPEVMTFKEAQSHLLMEKFFQCKMMHTEYNYLYLGFTEQERAEIDMSTGDVIENLYREGDIISVSHHYYYYVDSGKCLIRMSSYDTLPLAAISFLIANNAKLASDVYTLMGTHCQIADAKKTYRFPWNANELANSKVIKYGDAEIRVRTDIGCTSSSSSCSHGSSFSCSSSSSSCPSSTLQCRNSDDDNDGCAGKTVTHRHRHRRAHQRTPKPAAPSSFPILKPPANDQP